jgi:molybdenum cofactor cytidylyltransferase
MGRPKLALPLGQRTVLEHVVAALRQAAIEHILVVVGRHVPELVAVARAAGAQAALLADDTADMRATVVQGLRWLKEHFDPSPDDWWLLAPADHPSLHADVIRHLIAARHAHPRCSVFIPTYKGKRGHPTLIGWQHVGPIEALAAGYGLNAYLRQQMPETVEVSVASADILLDLDTPRDYLRLQKRWGSG